MTASGRERAAVLGAGGWGTALAIHLAASGRDVALWARDDALVSEMCGRRANPTYLPDSVFPEGLVATGSLERALPGAAYVVFAVPSHGLREVVRRAAPFIPASAVLVSATKGIEIERLQRMSEIITEETDGRHAVVALSGPSFASEVARRAPTALVAASADPAAVRAVQREFGSQCIRVYGSDDVVGVEVGAALKNVIAIAAGVVESLELGHNALAALVTRGLAEISRISCAMGGHRETLSGLSGLGDLVLTCTAPLSRNRHVGIELGRGRSLDAILAGMRTVAEGVRTTTAALALGARHGVELPIAERMAAVMAGRETPREAVGSLMLRPQRDEFDGAS